MILAAKRRIPKDLDLSCLEWLEYRDITRIADELKLRPDYIARVKRGEAYNVKVLAALLEKALKNKNTIKSLEQRFKKGSD